MEPSSDILELLRQVRDNQRELLDMTKKWEAKSDRQYQEWVEEIAKAKPGIARWEKANELWLKQIECAPRIDIVLLGLRLTLIAVLGIIAASFWLK